MEVSNYNRVITQEDNLSGNESGGVRRSGSRSRFLKKNKSKDAFLTNKDDEVTTFDN